MQATYGWTYEMDGAWHKLKVVLEEDDLRRFAVAHKIPVSVLDELSPAVCYELLQNEAEVLVLRRAASFGHQNEQRREYLEDVNAAVAQRILESKGLA